jgi:NTE family protein
MSRRNFLKAATVGTASAGLSLSAMNSVQAQSGSAEDSDLALRMKAASISEKLYAGDGLAIPIATKPTISNLAKGLDRTLVLGGGGVYYVAWYCGFFHGLAEQGLAMEKIPEMVVGTSAGAYMGSALLSGHFDHLRKKFDAWRQLL